MNFVRTPETAYTVPLAFQVREQVIYRYINIRNRAGHPNVGGESVGHNPSICTVPSIIPKQAWQDVAEPICLFDTPSSFIDFVRGSEGVPCMAVEAMQRNNAKKVFISLQLLSQYCTRRQKPKQMSKWNAYAAGDTIYVLK